MKSIAGPAKAGNVNLKGKKEKRLRCGCCTVIDLREKYREKQDKKDMERGQAGNAAVC